MATIPVRIRSEDLRKIDFLVKKGRYKNRSHAIRSLLLETLDREFNPSLFEDEDATSRRAAVVKKFVNAPDVRFVMKARPSLSEMVGQERERC
ncbi:MAG: ribbon-helix-helix domain-containing protein [Promethearchaeota archaeon]